MKKSLTSFQPHLWVTLGLLLLCVVSVYAQSNQVISGVVTDAQSGELLIGVSVKVKNTTNGTVSDIDGKYTLSNVPADSQLEFTYLGYVTKYVNATSPKLDVQLAESTKLLDEVIVVGYGVQKKSVVTAAISGVKADELGKVSPTRVDNVLRGLVSGVSITQASGQPGEASKVRVRGVGTINNSDPLYIVDGMPIDGGIDYLNPADIESIEVLKDAASAAIYGSRGANGVILVSTKQGKSGKAVISYNFSYGWQNPWRKRAVLNATEYATLMNEQEMNSGFSPIYDNPQSYGKGTDWQDKVFNDNAPIVQHQLSLSGGNDNGNYFLSFGYFNQEGIVGGNYDRSNYERYSFRFNNNYTMFDDSKERSFLSKLKVGTNLSYSRIKSRGINVNSEFGSPLGSALVISPLLGVYAENPDDVLAKYPNAVKDKNGKVYTVVGDEYNEITNPIAQLTLPGDLNNSDKIIANLWGELELYKNLKFKSSYGVDLAFWGKDGYVLPYYLGKSTNSSVSSVTSEMNRGFTWQIENTLTYTHTFKDVHNFTLLLGQSAKKDRYRSLAGKSYGMQDPGLPQLDATEQASDRRETWGRMRPFHTLASYFGRVSYNYEERYMMELTLRRDGSSNFGTNNKWANFPSVSAGWAITNEKFMANRPNYITSLKLRASWGKNGNESIEGFRYISLMNGNNDYLLGHDAAIIVAPGAKPNGYPNKDIKWEESIQTDFGFDSRFLDGALSFTFDWFDKKTSGMLMEMSLPSYIGDTPPIGNVGTMKNTGIEMDVSYKFAVKDVSVRLGVNASYIKNRLVKLGTVNGWANYDAIQNIGTITRGENGEPFPYFYGMKTNGLFQTQAEVDAYVNKEGTLLQAAAKPGDVRFVDTNGDGMINDDDRVKIGKGMPDWTYGFNINLNWKWFDLSALWQGTFGNDVFDGTRRIDLYKVNLPAYMLDRWTGPGSSNKIPRLTRNDENRNWQSSDLYVKNGSYLRLRSLQLGYTLPADLTRKVKIQNLRLYVNAENLLTITPYEGFDPEISSGTTTVIGTSLGVDRGVYPQARTISLGLNASF